MLPAMPHASSTKRRRKKGRRYSRAPAELVVDYLGTHSVEGMSGTA